MSRTAGYELDRFDKAFTPGSHSAPMSPASAIPKIFFEDIALPSVPWMSDNIVKSYNAVNYATKKIKFRFPAPSPAGTRH